MVSSLREAPATTSKSKEIAGFGLHNARCSENLMIYIEEAVSYATDTEHEPS